MPTKRRLLLPLLTLLLVALGVSISACGSESSQGNELVEGEPVEVGALSIDVLSSRYLHRKDKEDAAYLEGQPPVGSGLSWFGVFLEIQNESDRVKRVPAITINDSTGRTYSAFPSENAHALQFGESMKPRERLPKPATTAQPGADEGMIVIFRLGEAAIRNQPLTLHIEGFFRQEADVKLDL